MFIMCPIILSKFQPAMVLLSGLIFTCPVPSPAVMLRVKSTVLREFTQTTKVCEKRKTESHQRFTSCKCMTPCWVSCMYDVVFILPWKVSSRMDDTTFSVTRDAFHCDIFTNLHTNTSYRLLLEGTAVDRHVSRLAWNLKEKKMPRFKHALKRWLALWSMSVSIHELALRGHCYGMAESFPEFKLIWQANPVPP